jgi:hypothetical protein
MSSGGRPPADELPPRGCREWRPTVRSQGSLPSTTEEQRRCLEFRHRALTNIACSTAAYGGDSLRWSRARALPVEAYGGSAANELPHLAAGATTHAADEVLHP